MQHEGGSKKNIPQPQVMMNVISKGLKKEKGEKREEVFSGV